MSEMTAPVSLPVPRATTLPAESSWPAFEAAPEKRRPALSTRLPLASYATAVSWMESLAATTSGVGEMVMRVTGDSLRPGSACCGAWPC
jgi:hypothetical protein